MEPFEKTIVAIVSSLIRKARNIDTLDENVRHSFIVKGPLSNPSKKYKLFTKDRKLICIAI